MAKIGEIARRITGMSRKEIINHDFHVHDHLRSSEIEKRHELQRRKSIPRALRPSEMSTKKNGFIEFQGTLTTEEFRKFSKEAEENRIDVEHMVRVSNGSSFPMSPPKINAWKRFWGKVTDIISKLSPH